MLDCLLRSRGSRLVAAAFLAHSQTKSVSARRSSSTAARDPGAWNPPTSSALAKEKRLRSLLLSTAARDFPTPAARGSASRGCQAKLLAEEPSSALDEQVGE